MKYILPFTKSCPIIDGLIFTLTYLRALGSSSLKPLESNESRRSYERHHVMQNFDEYTQSIQAFFAEALAAAEAAKQAALADRAQAACELEIAKAYKKSFLVQLTLTHLNNGKTATDIMHWLGVSADFIESCQQKQEEVRTSIASYN